jgi:hypothetical protein
VKKSLTNNGGTVTIASGATLNDTIVAGSIFDNAKGAINGAGQLTVSGADTFEQGKATISGATVLLIGANLACTGTGAGAITTEGISVLKSGAPASGQTLNVVGTCSLNAVLDTSAFTDNGAIVLNSAACGNNATLAVSAAGTLTIGSTGSLAWPTGVGGSRSVTGSVVNNGILGNAGNGTNTLAVSGSLALGSTGSYEPTVTTSTSDDISVGGTVGGTLDPKGPFTSAHNYTILSGSFTGSFSATNGWVVTVGGTSVQMSHS